MPLPLTNLDTRRWTDLVDEGVALIPRYAPAWTDQNIHDPGRTLIELFAWLTEANLYRLNQVPARHRRKFHSLLGFRATPPRAALSLVSFTPDANTATFTLPSGVQFEAAGLNGERILFSTQRNLQVSVVTLAAVQVDRGDGKIQDRTADWHDSVPVAVFGQSPVPASAIYLGFRDLPTQQIISFALRFKGPGNDGHERERIIQEDLEQRQACRPILPDIRCEGETIPVAPPSSIAPPHHSARVVWEAFTGASGNPWLELKPVFDDTRSLTLDGFVELNFPPLLATTILGEVKESLYYLRCRLAAGGYDAPPLLLAIAPNSVAIEQFAPVWQQFAIAVDAKIAHAPPTLGQPIRLTMKFDRGAITEADFDAPFGPGLVVLSYNSPNVSPGAIILEAALVGRGTGRPLPRLKLPETPAQVESFHLHTHDGTDWQEWTRRDDFDSSVRTDFHYVLDAMGGEITFGDGERGRVPAVGELIFAVYRTTRASAGNVGTNAVSGPAGTPRNRVLLSSLQAQRNQLKHISNPPAIYGADEEDLTAVTGRAVETLHAHERLLDLCTEAKTETLDQLDRRAVEELRAPSNAVNLLDIERLALDVPGTRVARARASAGVHPDYPCLDASGVVTVVILPDMPVPKPQPTRGLLDVVKKYLNRRRMVCTRIEVVGPEYLEVQVIASVKLQTGANAQRVRTSILQTLNTFLDPRLGGPRGLGWPFGRAVYRSEIFDQIANVHGVSYVLTLSLRPGSGHAQCGDLSLCPWWLVSPGKHEIEVVR
jgi:hypothetical protein